MFFKIKIHACKTEDHNSILLYLIQIESVEVFSFCKDESLAKHIPTPKEGPWEEATQHLAELGLVAQCMHKS